MVRAEAVCSVGLLDLIWMEKFYPEGRDPTIGKSGCIQDIMDRRGPPVQNLNP
jgi:hypothetical protein